MAIQPEDGANPANMRCRNPRLCACWIELNLHLQFCCAVSGGRERGRARNPRSQARALQNWIHPGRSLLLPRTVWGASRPSQWRLWPPLRTKLRLRTPGLVLGTGTHPRPHPNARALDYSLKQCSGANALRHPRLPPSPPSERRAAGPTASRLQRLPGSISPLQRSTPAPQCQMPWVVSNP